jgi:hypothetical protein
MKQNSVLVVVAICCEDTIAFDTSFCGFCFDYCLMFVSFFVMLLLVLPVVPTANGTTVVEQVAGSNCRT